MRVQRVTQAGTLAIFLGLLWLAAHPYELEGVSDFFLRLDPLTAVVTTVVTRSWSSALLPGFAVIAFAVVAGRLFCGHVCPMGTTLDMADIAASAGTGKVKPSKSVGWEMRHWKYTFLAITLAAGVAGVSVAFAGSPLSLVTRLYALVLHPVALLAGDTLMGWSVPMLDTLGLSDLARAQLDHRVFATNAFVALLFVSLVALARYQPRFWCRNLCPAGAILALFSRKPLIRRHVNPSCTTCGKCARNCPTAAIAEDPAKTYHSECIVCLRCVEVCPVSAVHFGTGKRVSETLNVGPTRRSIVLGAASGLLTGGLVRTGIHQPQLRQKERPVVDAELIRAPGTLPEPEFLDRCIRCGECMKACPTNTLQPVWLKAGLEGLFSPVMLPRLAACALHCNVCGKVCPTGAIRNLPLVEKNHAKVGTAWIARESCLVWARDKKCLVCDEVCPYNAVSFRPVPDRLNSVPFVVANRCTGCGWCENKCPVEGTSAIRIDIIGEVRLSTGSYVENARNSGFVFRTKDNSADTLAPDVFDSAPQSDQ